MTRLPALDGLRAVAILLVVGSHFISHTIPGGTGVTLFFFISGFIITKVLLEDSRLAPFYIRRFFRLAPTLLVLLVIVFTFNPFNAGDVASVLLYYMNYHDFQTPGLDQTWSLAIEEHFYLIFPTLVLLLSVKRVEQVLLFFIVASLAWRLALVGLDEVARIHRSTDTRLDSIAFGCLLAVLAALPERRRIVDMLASRWGQIAGWAVLLGCSVVRDERFRETARYSLQGLAFMPIFAALFLRPGTAPAWLRKSLEWKPTVYVGTISYSLYLYHGVGAVFGVGFGVDGLAIGVAATLASYYFVEVPTRRLGHRLAARHVSRPLPTSTTKLPLP